MASVTKRPNGDRWIQFVGHTGKRHTIRLGRATTRQAEEFKRRVEDLAACRELGQIPAPRLMSWLTELPGKIHARMAASGLVEDRPFSTVAELLIAWQESSKWAPTTRKNITAFIANMKAFFTESANIGDINASDAARFFQWLETSGSANGGKLAQATVSRRIRWARQLFRFAQKSRAIADNPFDAFTQQNEVNRSRDFFVTRQLAQSIIDVTPDREFRALFALARFGGVRTPSEVHGCQWQDVYWERSTMMIRGSKTGDRIIPLSASLEIYLRELWEQTDAVGLVFTSYQTTGAAITSKLQRTCRAAGVAMWPKPWQNCRATCETEWLGSHPIHEVAAWMGHSPTIALKHYAQIVKEQAACKAAQDNASPSLVALEAKQKAK